MTDLTLEEAQVLVAIEYLQEKYYNTPTRLALVRDLVPGLNPTSTTRVVASLQRKGYITLLRKPKVGVIIKSKNTVITDEEWLDLNSPKPLPWTDWSQYNRETLTNKDAFYLQKLDRELRNPSKPSEDQTLW
jgi:hypothetical protein